MPVRSLARMAVAKVEPLLTTRSVSGPFDYRLPEAMDYVDVGSVLVVPFGRRRVVGVVVGLAERSRPARGSPRRADRGAGGRRAARAGRPGASGSARSTARRPPGAWAWSCRPGSAPGPRRDGSGRWSSSRWRRRPRGSRRCPAERGSVCASGPCCARWSPARRLARRLAATAGSDRATLRRLESRGLVTTREVERRRRHDSPGVGAVREGVELTRRSAGGAALSGLCLAREGRCGGRLLSAPRGDRLGQDGGLPRGAPGGAGAGEGSDRPRPGDRPDASDDGPLPAAIRRRRRAPPLQDARGCPL